MVPVSDAREAAGPQVGMMRALAPRGRRSERMVPAGDAREAAGWQPQTRTMPAPRLAGGSDISRYRGGANGEAQ